MSERGRTGPLLTERVLLRKERTKERTFASSLPLCSCCCISIPSPKIHVSMSQTSSNFAGSRKARNSLLPSSFPPFYFLELLAELKESKESTSCYSCSRRAVRSDTHTKRNKKRQESIQIFPQIKQVFLPFELCVCNLQTLKHPLFLSSP